MMPDIQFRYTLVVDKDLWLTKLRIIVLKNDSLAKTHSNVELGTRDFFGGPSFFPIFL